MRLQLAILRHELPEVRIIFNTNTTHGPGRQKVTTVSDLLQALDAHVPLESADGEWGFEDYVVEVSATADQELAYECLHYQDLGDVLHDDDEVVIRALSSEELRDRRQGGRIQIAQDGGHLIDGLSWGRRWRGRQRRSDISIPPRKRRRIIYEDDADVLGLEYTKLDNADEENDEDDDDDDYKEDEEEEEDWESPEQASPLHITARGEFDDADADADEDLAEHAEPGTHDVSKGEELELDADEQAELAALNDEARQLLAESKAVLASSRSKRAKSRSRSSVEEIGPKQVSFLEEQLQSNLPKPNGLVDYNHAAPSPPAREPNLRARNPITVNGEGMDEVDSDVSESDESTSSSSEDSSSVDDSESAGDSQSDTESDSESSESSESSGLSEAATKSPPRLAEHVTNSIVDLSEHNNSQAVLAPKTSQVMNPPGSGSLRTKLNNARNKKKILLKNLKAEGKLEAEADFKDLQRYLSREVASESLASPVQQSSRSKQANDVTFEDKRRRLLDMLGANNADGVSDPPGLPLQSDVRETISQDQGKLDEASKTQHKNEINSEVVLQSRPLSSEIGIKHTPNVREGLVTESTTAQTSPAPRAKLDLASSRRMLFNALGVRTPKNTEDENALRKKLSMFSCQVVPRSDMQKPYEDPEPSDLNRWCRKLVVTAVECTVPRRKLDTPPFPFQHPWQMRKARESVECSTEVQNMLFNREGHATPANPKVDANTLADKNGLEIEPDGDGTTHGNHAQLFEKDHAGHNVSSGIEENPDWMCPYRIDLCSDLNIEDVVPNAKISYREIHLNDNSEPEVSPWRFASVLSRNGLRIRIVLAEKSRRVKQVGYDERGGKRYHGFELGDDQSDIASDVDDGLREIEFDQFMAAKLLRPGLIASSIANDPPADDCMAVQISKEIDHSAEVVDTPTRHHIDGLIKEAGFVSELDEGLQEPFYDHESKISETVLAQNSATPHEPQSSSQPSESMLESVRYPKLSQFEGEETILGTKSSSSQDAQRVGPAQILPESTYGTITTATSEQLVNLQAESESTRSLQKSMKPDEKALPQSKGHHNISDEDDDDDDESLDSTELPSLRYLTSSQRQKVLGRPAIKEESTTQDIRPIKPLSQAMAEEWSDHELEFEASQSRGPAYVPGESTIVDLTRSSPASEPGQSKQNLNRTSKNRAVRTSRTNPSKSVSSGLGSNTILSGKRIGP